MFRHQHISFAKSGCIIRPCPRRGVVSGGASTGWTTAELQPVSNQPILCFDLFQLASDFFRCLQKMLSKMALGSLCDSFCAFETVALWMLDICYTSSPAWHRSHPVRLHLGGASNGQLLRFVISEFNLSCKSQVVLPISPKLQFRAEFVRLAFHWFHLSCPDPS